MWRATGAAGRLWLFGSVHALPPGIDWLGGAVGQALAAAGALAVEVPVGGDPAAAAADFLRRARAAGLPPVAERLPPALRPTLARACAAIGLTPAQLDPLASWGAALTLGGAASAAAGATRAAGVEAVLARRFAEAGKPVAALESVAGQLDAFAALPEADQRHLLARAVFEAADPARAQEAVVAAWASGDVAALAARLREGTPALRAALIDRRNARFAAWATARLARPGAALLVLGAGHMVGPGSVPMRLAATDARVQRVQ